MAKKWILTVFTALAWAACMGQAASKTIPFTEKTHDFGEIREEKGPVKHKFTFTNNTRQPIVIEHVEVNCGCTTTDFSRKPVMPGQTGYLTVTFDPANRPGVFSKTIAVAANNNTLQTVLTVMGTVIGRVRPVGELYPIALGDGIRIDTRSAYFRNVGQGQASSMVVGWANASAKQATLAFQVEPRSPYIRIDAPEKLAPGDKGNITVTFNLGGQTAAYGIFSHKIYPIINGKRQNTPISVLACGIDAFNGEPDKTPRARFDRHYHDFGNLKSGQKTVSAQFTLTDTGAAPLVVRYVACGRGLATDLKAGTTIGTGKSLTFKVTLDPAAHPADMVSESIMIIVNDPLRPVREIRIAAVIQ